MSSGGNPNSSPNQQGQAVDKASQSLFARIKAWPWENIGRAAEVLSSVVGLVVAVVALVIANDSRDIHDAVANISSLATQTKRQADASETLARNAQGQLVAAQGQLVAAQEQTRAVAAQTAALIASSDAQARAAEAQRRMADVTAKAQIPDVDLIELQVNGLTAVPDAAGNVPATLFWRFRNSGGSALIVKQIYYGLWIEKTLPEKIPDGGQVFPGYDTIVTPTITSAFAPADPLKLNLQKARADEIVSGKQNLFFFAVFKYADQAGETHSKCFGRLLILAGGQSTFFTPAGGLAYQCKT